MKKQIFLVAAALLLVGQGCIGGSSGPSGSDGGVWQTIDDGRTWSQLSALPSETGVVSLGGVNVTSIEIDPSDHTAYYIGTESNGMLYSLDSGSTWQRPEDNEARSGWVVTVEIDPRNVCTAYVLKRDRVLKTLDCGRTYESVFVETRDDEQLTDMSLDWFKPDTVWVTGTEGDVVRTDDAGETWSTIYNADDEIVDLLVSTADSRIVLVGTEDKGVHKTIDGGETWEENERELRDEFEQADRIYGFSQTNNGDTIIMNTRFGLLRSLDQGVTWESLPPTPAADEEIWSVAIDPHDPNTIYFGTMDILYSSTNAGDAWTTNEFPSTRAPKAILVHPSETERVLAGFAAIED